MDAMTPRGRMRGHVAVRAAPCLLACALLVAMAPVGGAAAEERDAGMAGVSEELRHLRERIDEASHQSNATAAALFVVGLAVAAIAVYGTHKSLGYLGTQSRYFERHLEHLREDMRAKTWPVLSWVTIGGRLTHEIGMRADDSRLVTIRVMNVGTASALNVKSWEVCGVSDGGGGIVGERRSVRSWGSLPPGGFMDISVLVSAKEHRRVTE